MKLSEIMMYLQEVAPLELAESWDNVGLLAGDRSQEISKVILAIDLTAGVMAEARKRGAELILAYHPPIFEPIKKVVAGQGPSPYLFEAVRNGIAIYSMHTALDVARGGINDLLAEIVGIDSPQPLAISQAVDSQYCKVVVFVPVADLEKVSEAMFAAGAGIVGKDGNYSKCSFRVDGIGTFQCGPQSNPTIGSPGSFEEVKEFRLETIVPKQILPAVLSAMLKAHSYQEVAYDIYPLIDNKNYGLGRFGKLRSAISKKKLIAHIKKTLAVDTVGIIGPETGKVKIAAVGAGSCGSLLKDVIARGCDFYLTGELKHHDALKLQEAGVTTVCVSHSNSERIILKQLAAGLNSRFKGIKAFVSSSDKDPFVWK